jgi:hypothetical protein
MLERRREEVLALAEAGSIEERSTSCMAAGSLAGLS